MSDFKSGKIKELLNLSQDLGREDRDLAILGEGNTSCRLDAKTFLVKASGSRLADLNEGQLVACRFEALLPLFERKSMTDAEIEAALLASRVNASAPKPSIEAVFHAYLLSLPGIDIVGHTHPIAVNSALCASDAWAMSYANERRFPDEIVCCGARSVLVPYADPGIGLATEIKKRVEQFVQEESRPPRLILLQNHGLIACAATPGAVLSATLMAEKAARIFLGAALLGGAQPLKPENVARIDSRPDEHYRQRMLAQSQSQDRLR
jgi:rhamnose utilization protein RhaD (predicted bifunctional aldolase and dehydrogenase)